ncbi:hypothetical protein TcCL_ESM08927 [Trypanosoma cruzi]|nr:hypothetical protein TcCL_ESM08927 [Trypanosoma cruzi]
MLLSLVKRVHPAHFIFSPSHCGIPRNEAADEKATTARSLQDCVTAWHVDFLTAVKRLCWEEFQEEEEVAHTGRQALVGVKKKTFLVSRQASGIESRLRAQIQCDSCPLLGRLARALRITRNPLFGGAPPLTLKRQDRPDLLRNLHLACSRHLLVERRAADQRRPAQAAAASSRPSTI